MSEGNGQKDNESRLDRLEDAYNLRIQDHEDFRREHQALLAAQVVMQDSLTRLRDRAKTTAQFPPIVGRTLVCPGQAEACHTRPGRPAAHWPTKCEVIVAQLLSVKVEETGDTLNGLISRSEKTQRDNEQRFRRLEEK